MVTGWRKAFCTSIPKERDTTVLGEKPQKSRSGGGSSGGSTGKSPRFGSRFGFFSNPTTPRLQSQPVSTPSLRCRITTTTKTTATPTSSVPNSPKLQCKTITTPKKQSNNSSPRLFQLSNPSSPKSPSSFSLLRATLRLSKTRCGICLQSVKAGQGTAIFTAECSHSFHFPCIVTHTKKNHLLVCPVCSTSWKELPLLSVQQQKIEPEAKPLKDILTKPLRVYNDDEPLRSPVSLAKFNPIPESEETENDEEESEQEFKGFFVNHSITPKFGRQISINSRNVEVRLLPEAAAVALSRSYETYVVVLKVKAPPPPAARGARRPPIDLVTVLDVSGRMNGVRLQMMKRAMNLVISSLSETDRLSIVMFSSASKRLSPLRRMSSSGRRSARRIVEALGSNGQGMSVNDALKKAEKVLEDRREKNAVASIMLLSDDRDELSKTKPTNPDFAVVSSTRFPDLEIPVFSVGFGECTNAPSDDVFRKVVLAPLSVVVQDLRLQLGFLSGSAPAEISAVYSLTARPTSVGSDSLRIGDLYSGEERELLLELKVPASSGGAHRVLSVRSSHRDPFAQEVVYSQEEGLLIPRLHAVRSTSPSIGRLRNLHVSTRAVVESRRLIERNDLSGAHHLLTSARALLMQSGSGSAEEFLRGLEAELADLNRRRQQVQIQRRRVNANGQVEDKAEPLTPTSAWRAAERLAKVAIMRKHMNRVSDLHGFENARF
ncbi:hypothetical protein SLE2022_300140 [Rubroshorea leprosula]